MKKICSECGRDLPRPRMVRDAKHVSKVNSYIPACVAKADKQTKIILRELVKKGESVTLNDERSIWIDQYTRSMNHELIQAGLRVTMEQLREAFGA